MLKLSSPNVSWENKTIESVSNQTNHVWVVCQFDVGSFDRYDSLCLCNCMGDLKHFE